MIDRTTAVVPSLGHGELAFDSRLTGDSVDLIFIDGNLVDAICKYHFPPAPGATMLQVVVSDVNVAVEHRLVVTAPGKIQVQTLPTVNAALYCINREVAVGWSSASSMTTVPPPSSRLLRPCMDYATQIAAIGSIAP